MATTVKRANVFLLDGRFVPTLPPVLKGIVDPPPAATANRPASVRKQKAPSR
jgi:hypothetical protein